MRVISNMSDLRAGTYVACIICASGDCIGTPVTATAVDRG